MKELSQVTVNEYLSTTYSYLRFSIKVRTWALRQVLRPEHLYCIKLPSIHGVLSASVKILRASNVYGQWLRFELDRHAG